MSLSARLCLGLCLAFSFYSGALYAAPVDLDHARAELSAIEKLSATSTTEALQRFEVLKAKVGNDAPYPFMRDLLRMEVFLHEDAGELEKVYIVERAALKLALANNDPGTATLSRLGAVRELLDSNKVDEAEKKLAEVARGLPADASPGLKGSLARVEGDIYNAKSQFEKALAAYLRAMKLEQDLNDSVDGNIDLLMRIARVYINIDNPAKAIETTQQALKQKRVTLRAAGTLRFTQGIALINLNRGPEAIAAFEQALEAARMGGLTGLESGVRGNIADYYLRQHDYPRAEKEARLALAASEKVTDQNMVLMAKANIGFALMGQGRVAAGLPYTEEVIAALRKAGAVADVEAMMDEKSRMLEQHGLFKDALATVREQQVLQKTTSRQARDRAVAALQEEFDASQRTRQIELLKRENQLQDADLRTRRIVQYGTTIAAILTVVAGAIMFVLYRRAAHANGRLHELNTQLEFHSMRDSLTGLHNRRSFQQKMAGRTGQARERRKESGEGVDCFALMDIDHFKHINDRWGHGVGDAVLVEVARRLNATVRDTDMVLRWGGEEFMIYAPHADRAHITEMIGRVLKAIGATPVDAGSCEVPVTMSAGVITLPFGGSAGDAFDWEGGIRLADWALYQGKANGRNQANIVSHLSAPIDTVLEALEAGKPNDGLLTLDCVHGPAQPSAAPAPESRQGKSLAVDA